MILTAFTAAAVGFLHSLAPGHWLPIVLVKRTRRWSSGQGALGALVTAAGHVAISIALGFIAIEIGHHLFTTREELIEKYAGLAVSVYGLAYAIWAYFTHSHCHGHTHHGPEPHGRQRNTPYFFLFMAGFSPCVAALPLFVESFTHGWLGVSLTMMAFAGGVAISLISSTLLVSAGIMKLDHPLLEHYGDVITGGFVCLMGLVIFLLP